MNGMIGRKLGMARVFADDGARVPVTVLEVGPCPVVQVTPTSVQLGFGARKAKRTPKAIAGHVKRAGLETAPRVLESFVLAGEPPKAGEAVTVAIFAAGDRVKVSGVTKGRGFQGVVHRHHFGGGPATHGNTQHRQPGSTERWSPTSLTSGRARTRPRPAASSPAATRSPGARRVRAGRAKARFARPSGGTAASSSVPTPGPIGWASRRRSASWRRSRP